MIDFKKTLINLHEKFPEYDLDKLIEIIDAIVETVDFNKINYPTGTRDWWNGPLSDKGIEPPFTTISYDCKSDFSDTVDERISKWTDIMKKGISISDPCRHSIIE